MQSCFRDRLADWLTKLGNDYLIGLFNHICAKIKAYKSEKDWYGG